MEMLNIFSQHVTQGQINVVTWFLVLPIDIENKSTINCINIYIYIKNYTSVLGIIFSQSLPLYIEIYRVGDNRRTVNTSTSPHISGQLGTTTRVKYCYQIMLIYRKAMSSGLQ